LSPAKAEYIAANEVKKDSYWFTLETFRIYCHFIWQELSFSCKIKEYWIASSFDSWNG
jgi:hypothetical protein